MDNGRRDSVRDGKMDNGRMDSVRNRRRMLDKKRTRWNMTMPMLMSMTGHMGMVLNRLSSGNPTNNRVDSLEWRGKHSRPHRDR